MRLTSNDGSCTLTLGSCYVVPLNIRLHFYSDFNKWNSVHQILKYVPTEDRENRFLIEAGTHSDNKNSTHKQVRTAGGKEGAKEKHVWSEWWG